MEAESALKESRISETCVRVRNAMGELVLFVIDRFPAYRIRRKKFGLDSDKTGKVRLLLFLAPLPRIQSSFKTSFKIS